MRCWHERETNFHYYCTNKYIDAICLRTKKRISYSRHSNRLNRYEGRLRKTVERSLRKRHAIRNDGTRRHHKKYKVSDEEVNKEVEKVKNNMEINSKSIRK